MMQMLSWKQRDMCRSRMGHTNMMACAQHTPVHQVVVQPQLISDPAAASRDAAVSGSLCTAQSTCCAHAEVVPPQYSCCTSMTLTT